MSRSIVSFDFLNIIGVFVSLLTGIQFIKNITIIFVALNIISRLPALNEIEKVSY